MYRTLIVDDDPDTVELLQSFLPPREFQTVTETTFSGAVERIASFNPEFILLDVVLSGESGFDLLRHIRHRKLKPVVFMVTGFDSVKGASAYDLDVHLFLRKPLENPTEMRAAALRFLREYKLTRVDLDLSKREFQILELISKGMTTKEIATDLGISGATVAKHRENMLRRSRSKNTMELINKYRVGG